MSTLTPHGACLLWKPELIWLNAVSDAMVAVAFFATAFVLGLFVWRRRRDVMFRSVFWALAIFAAVCGVTRLLSILTLWVPAYDIEGLTKGVLALISVAVTVAMLLVRPRLLVLPTRIQLQQAYAALEEEIRQRRKAEAMVKRFQEIEANEAQVRQAQKMEAIGQLTGGVAHDFNNILTVITGSIEILGDAVKDHPQLVQITDMISAAAARGADLTQHLLAFARRQPLQPRSTDVNALVIDAARLLRPTLGEQIEIESMLAHDAAPALIDPSQLSTAILNLALNARDAMPQRRQADAGNQECRARRGLRPHEQRGQAGQLRHDRGERHRGRESLPACSTRCSSRSSPPRTSARDRGSVSAWSTASSSSRTATSRSTAKQGHGTTVKLYLPQAQPAVPDALAAEPGIAGGEHGDKSILIVEDDALVREYVVTQIGRFGYRTLAAGNAAEALAIINGPERIDLLFTDVIIPGGMNGRQLATEALKRRPGLKVLYTSGYTENAIVHHGRLDAGVLLLPKPYLSSDLARMIRTALVS